MCAHHLRNQGTLAPMSDESRGKDLERRRLALGITSHRQFEEAVAEELGITRGTIARAEAGKASRNTYTALEAWLTRQEEEAGMDVPPPAPTSIKLTVHGVYGIDDLILEGPSDHPEELAEAFGMIIERLKSRED